MKAGKKTKQLPSRGSLYDLTRKQSTIVDYAKATPMTEREPNPAAILNLARKK